MKKLLLFGATLFSFAAAQAQCTELFFSEIVEGSGNDKAFEIYNPTANPINLSNYRVVRFSNGSPTPVDSSALVGTVGAYDVFTLVNGQTVAAPNSPACSPALQAMADQLDALYPASTYANGDDAICLVKISPYQIIDIYGRIGEDPGTAWTDEFPFNGGTGTWLTVDHTLIRKSTVQTGVTTNPTFFDAFAEWDTLPKNTWTNLNIHSCACGTVGLNSATKSNTLSVFPNPSNGNDLTIVTTGVSNSIVLINALGETILEKTTTTVNEVVAMKNLNLAKGIYFVKVRNNGSALESVQKIIVQ